MPDYATSDQVRNAYKQYLGRDFSDPNEGTLWQQDANWENGIKNSGEAQAYSAKQNQPPPAAASAPNLAAPPPPPAPAAPPSPSTTKDQWGNATGSQQSQIDTFWNEVTNGHRNNFSPDELRAWGVTQISPDKYRLPNGQEVDTVGDYGGANTMGQWSITGGKPGENGQPGGPGTGAAGGAGGAGGGGYAGGVAGTINGSTTASSGSDPMQAAVQAAILKQLGTLQTPTDGDSSTVHSITDPYHLQSQRGLEATRRALAEQAYANGNLNTGGYGQSQIAAVENAGANEANFTGQTVATQEAQRMSMLQNILGLGNNSTQFTQQLSATQKNFADQLSQQDRQFAATLAQNVAQYGQSLGYQYALLDWSKKQKITDGATSPIGGV